MKRVIAAGGSRMKRGDLKAYMHVIMQANPRIVEEVLKMRSAALNEVLERSGLTAEWKERGRQEGRLEGKLEIARNLLKRGWTKEAVAETVGADLQMIRALKRNK
jgi:predicted transposase YdaD